MKAGACVNANNLTSSVKAKPRTSIFFDLDGTLCDPREGIVRCIQYALVRSGRATLPEEQLVRFIGPPLHDCFASLLGSTDGISIQRAVDFYRERFIAKGIFENRVYPGITEMLSALENDGYRLFVVTSKPAVFAREILEQSGFMRFFRGVYGSELDGTRADKGELIAHVLERERIHPAGAIMIGDREHDIKSALANGVRPIGVLWGYGSGEELEKAGATALCETPQSIIVRLR